MTTPAESLPSPLDEIAEVAGFDAALKIAEAVGGTRVSIPTRLPETHWLIDAVGKEKAEVICKYFTTLSPENRPRGARHVIIPLGPASRSNRAKRAFYTARENGASVREAARIANVHEYTGFRWEKSRKSGAADKRQLTLFAVLDTPKEQTG